MTFRLISWGANSHGQLGQGIRSEECLLPREIDLSGCSLKPENVRKIRGGAGHTLVLDNDGRIYSCGWNNKGQTGLPGSEDLLSFREIGGALKNQTVVDVACGWDYSAALTANGTLFLWGSNCFGQLGKEPSDLRWTHEPFEATIGRKIDRVAMGLRHTALITKDGKVLMAGASNKGQLGLEAVNCVCTFTEVSALPEVEDISCGQHHTVALTRQGDLYAFGDNKYGQLGFDPKTLAKTTRPVKVTSIRLRRPIRTHTGWSHAVTLSGGQIYSWGRNTYGELGSPENRRSTPWKAAEIEGLGKIRQISCGSEHNIILNEDGTIYCWGWNEHGNCGTGNTEDVHFPKRLSLSFDYAATIVGAGAGHSLAVIETI